MAFEVRADACRRGGTDYFAEAVITGTAVARFADQRDTAPRPSVAILPLDAAMRKRRAERPFNGQL
jgi:hypothetical protein